MAEGRQIAIGDRLAEAAAAGRAALERRARAIDDLNVFPVADGDTGTNMLLTARAVEQAAREGAGVPWPERCDALARAALTAARGNSGMILSQLVRGAAEALAGGAGIDGPRMAAAIRGASAAADRAVRRPVEGTMLTVARRMAEAAEPAAAAGGSAAEVLDAAVAAAYRAVAETPDQLPVLKEAGVVDAGGLGVAVLAEGFAAALAGREPPAGEVADAGPPPRPDHAPSRYRYCTSFLVEGPGDLAALEEALAPLGDSLLVMGDARRAKVHLHTDAPERAMERAGGHGAVSDPSVEDMRRQEAERAARLARAAAPPARCGALCVAEGDGLRSLLRSLGAEVLQPAPGAPPGAAELAEALAGLGTPEAVLLPGDPALLSAAEGAARRFAGTAAVVPALSSPAALAALVALDPERGAPENRAAMAELSAQVRVGEVRRTAEGGVEAFLDGEPLGAAAGLRAGLERVLERLEGSALVTVLIGSDGAVAPAEAEEWVRARLPDAEAEAHAGGQPAPALLVGAE